MMRKFQISLDYLTNRLSASVDPFLEWLGSQHVEELDTKGNPTGRKGKVLVKNGNNDLSVLLPVSFSDELIQLPFHRLRLFRNPPKLNTTSTLADLDHAFRRGYFVEIRDAYANLQCIDPQWQIYYAASLSSVGRLEESLKILNSFATTQLPDELTCFRIQVHMDLLRYSNKPAAALELGLSMTSDIIGKVSTHLKARYFIREATARHEADLRDVQVLPLLDHAITLLAEGHPRDQAEALMHRAKFMRGKERLDEAEKLLLQCLKLLHGSDSLYLCGLIFGNLSGIYLDKECTTPALLYASAAATCFRHVECWRDLIKTLSILSTEEPCSDRKSQYVKEANKITKILHGPDAPLALPLPQAMDICKLIDACKPDDLACVCSGDGVGINMLKIFTLEYANNTGIDPNQLLSWAVLGAKMYHATMRRGQPAVSVKDDVITEVAEHWLEAISKDGTEENVKYKCILKYLENEFPCTHPQLATTLLHMFRNQSTTPLDSKTENAVFNIIMFTLSMGFQLEFCFDNACAKVIEQSKMADGFEKIVQLNDDQSNPDIIDWVKLTNMCMPDALPWPLDLRCRCGANLTPFIYCCSPENPISMEHYTDKLLPGFQIERECCGAMLSGFQCDCCHQLYTWDIGVVETVCKL